MSTITRSRFPDVFDKTMAKRLSKHKAKEMLEHGKVHGKKLTKKQKGFFGAVAGGNSNRNLVRGKMNKF